MQINVLVFALYLTSQEADSDLILVKKIRNQRLHVILLLVNSKIFKLLLRLGLKLPVMN